jgi:alpha-galactosidase
MTGQTLSAGGVVFSDLAPLIDGAVPAVDGPQIAQTGRGWTLSWSIGAQRFVVEIDTDPITLKIVLEGVAGGSVDSLGLRIGRAANVVRYLRNGYTSWDGSYFVELDAARGIIAADPTAAVGHAMTALVSEAGEAAVLGFLRHDRFQSRFRFAFAAGPLSIDVETLIDGSVRGERIEAEPLILLSGVDVEETLREWARRVAQASPLPPRIHERRIAGWCSWYNLYASITEPIILEHLAAAAQFRDRHHVPFDVFQIDDGFTPEMGDWLDVKPQFPRGMKPLLADIRARGFTPGLWIAPFMIGNRSRLYAEHPDWVVVDRSSGKPIAPMTFYGEFRWHKRSEEYYVLDITHPAAEAYVRKVFRTWARDWGCGYFKTDFMFFGSDYGPREARWHEEGWSRIEIWMRMARLIREEIGDALWLGCGGPIWAGIGLLDAVRIGRDVGVSWEGHYSAESLLRDQTSRNFGNGIFWQSDPDCILLRERFHHLTDEQVRSLALFAGLSGGVLMTSDRLDEISDERARLLADLARDARPQPCEFPQLGRVPLRHRIGTSHTGAPKLMSEGDPVLMQRIRKPDGTVVVALLNTGSTPADREIDGVRLSLPPYTTRMLPRQ